MSLVLMDGSPADHLRKAEEALRRARDEGRSLFDRIHDAGNALAAFRLLGQFRQWREARSVLDDLEAAAAASEMGGPR